MYCTVLYLTGAVALRFTGKSVVIPLKKMFAEDVFTSNFEGEREEYRHVEEDFRREIVGVRV